MKVWGLGLAAVLTVASAWAKKPMEESGVVAEVTSPVQLEAIFNAAHELFMPPLPGDAVYIHPETSVYFVDWNSGEWSKELLSQAVGELQTLGSLMFPEYTFYVVLGYNRDLVIYNQEGAAVFRRTVEYDPYFWALDHFGLSDTSLLSPSQQELYHAAKLGVEIRIVPVSFAESYLEEEVVVAEQEALSTELLMAPMSMMSAPLAMESGVELQLEIDRLTNGTVEVLVEWLSSLNSDSLDLFFCSDLVAADWQLQTNFLTAGLTHFDFNDLDTNETARFYVAGTMYDKDSDGLTSARERYLYKTREDLFSTDGDGLGDGWEIGYGFDPFSTAGNDGALGDADNDGFSNLEEQAKGTDPTTPQNHSTTGTVATIRYHYDEDDRLSDFYSGTEVAQKTILTASHNISEDVSAK